MADTLMLEVRDRGTLIPVLAIRPGGGADSDAEQWLWLRAGYGDAEAQHEYVLLAEVNGGSGRITCDPYDWGSNHTLRAAHDYIRQHWYDLRDGDVVDVEFIRGDSIAPKVSERR